MSFGTSDGESLKIDLSAIKKKKGVKKKLSAPNMISAFSTSNYIQDEEFVYPSLDLSDDNDDMVGTRPVKDKDGAWHPKGKSKQIKRSLTKRDRMPRESAKKQEVAKVLQMASQRIKEKRSLKHKRLRKSTPATKNESRMSSATAAASSSTSISNATATTVNNGVCRPKKGLATAKQRLGKKLKLKFL